MPASDPSEEARSIQKHFRDTDPPYYVGDDLHRAKLDNAHRHMEQHGLDAILVFRDEIIRYLTDFFVKGYGPWKDLEYVCVLPRDEEPILGYASGTDRYRIGLQALVEDTRRLPGIEDWDDTIVDIFEEYGISGRVGTDLLPFSLFQSLDRQCPEIEFEPVEDFWHGLTAIKSDREIEIIDEAIAIAEIGMRTAIETAGPGVTEREVAIEAEYAMRKAGSEMEPFICDLCAGKNAAVFNRIPSTNRLRNGDLVAMDMGAVYRGYNGEFARTVSVGDPSDEQRSIYQATYDALQAGLETIEPGTTCHDVDQAVREVIREAGYERYEHDRATGHQTAYGLHGAPAIDHGVEATLEPGMVVNIEPRIAMFDQPWTGGVQLEEIVLVQEDGTERLTHTEFDDSLLDP